MSFISYFDVFFLKLDLQSVLDFSTDYQYQYRPFQKCRLPASVLDYQSTDYHYLLNFQYQYQNQYQYFQLQFNQINSTFVTKYVFQIEQQHAPFNSVPCNKVNHKKIELYVNFHDTITVIFKVLTEFFLNTLLMDFREKVISISVRYFEKLTITSFCKKYRSSVSVKYLYQY